MSALLDKATWEHFEHPADMGIRGIGPTCAAAFEQGALALTAVLLPSEQVKPEQRIAITCEGDDETYLFVDWLNAILYEMDVRHMLFGRFEVILTESGLTAQVWGELIDPQRHCPAVQVKAATLAELEVKQRADGWWVAQCIVDV